MILLSTAVSQSRPVCWVKWWVVNVPRSRPQLIWVQLSVWWLLLWLPHRDLYLLLRLRPIAAPDPRAAHLPHVADVDVGADAGVSDEMKRHYGHLHWRESCERG